MYLRCTRSGPLSASDEIVAEVHHTTAAGPLLIARSVAHSLDLLKTTDFQSFMDVS